MGAPPVLPADKRLSLPPTPDAPFCAALWDKYQVPEHIRRHCQVVSEVAVELADLLSDAGVPADPGQALAAGLLHDLAKMHTVTHGGHHGPLGGAWIVAATRHTLIAQAVFHHVYWPWDLDLDSFPLPLILIYADKRVRHDSVVTLPERYSYIMDRYGGRSEGARDNINMCHQQWLAIENLLSARLGVNLDAHTFDRRRLV